MIKLFNHLNIFIFRSSPVNIKAFVGKEGWFFMSGEEIKTYSGTSLFTQNELNEFKDEMLLRKKMAEENNAHFFIAIVPNKSNIYPEYMPDHIIKTNGAGYGKQLLNFLQENNFPVIDLYTPLLNSKKDAELYYHTDTHWNNYGAFMACNAVLNEFGKYAPNVKPLDLRIYKPHTVIEEAGDIAKMFSMEHELKEKNPTPVRPGGSVSYEKKQNKYTPTKGFPYPDDYEYTRYTNNDSLPTVLIIRDSFGKKIFPYISEQSKKCVAIYDGWHYGRNEKIIKEEKPDIILLLVLESNLRNVLDNKNLNE